MAQQDFNSPQEFHSKLGLVFNATMALPLLPFVFLFLEIKNNAYTGFIEPGLPMLAISYGIPILSGLLVVKGFKLVESTRRCAAENEDLKEKLSVYYPGLSKLYILVGAACGIMSIGLWLTSSGVIIVAYVILLFTMSFYRPTPRRYVKDLHLKDDQKDIILNKKDFKF